MQIYVFQGLDADLPVLTEWGYIPAKNLTPEVHPITLSDSNELCLATIFEVIGPREYRGFNELRISGSTLPVCLPSYLFIYSKIRDQFAYYPIPFVRRDDLVHIVRRVPHSLFTIQAFDDLADFWLRIVNTRKFSPKVLGIAMYALYEKQVKGCEIGSRIPKGILSCDPEARQKIFDVVKDQISSKFTAFGKHYSFVNYKIPADAYNLMEFLSPLHYATSIKKNKGYWTVFYVPDVQINDTASIKGNVSSTEAYQGVDVITNGKNLICARMLIGT